MKKNLFIFCILLGFTNILVAQKVIKSVSLNDQQYFFKSLGGYHFGCDVRMGYASGKGNLYFNENKNLAFRIFVLGREDSNGGFLENLKIQTEDYKKYYFLLDWKNYKKNNGTLEANVEIQYNAEDQSDWIDFFFVGKDNWHIYTRINLEKEQRIILNTLVKKYFSQSLGYKNLLEQKNFIKTQQRINDSIQIAQKKISDSIEIANKKILESIQIAQKKISDSIELSNKKISAKLLPGMPSTLSTGLLAYYPFNGNANDESGNGYNGTVNGATLTTDRFGNANSAYGFDALKSNFMTTTNSLSEAKDGSISAWIYFAGEINGGNPRTYNDWYSIVDKFLVNGNKNDAGHLKLVYSASDANQIFSESVVSTNAWRHIVITSISNTAKIYIDGIQSGIKALAPGYNFFEKIPFIIGKSVNNRWYFNGRIDEIRLYSRELKQDEITYLSNN